MTNVLKWGMSAQASAAFLATGIDPARLGQTIGTAPASAGTHEQDGTDPEGHPYTAAVDLSLRRPTPIDVETIHTLLETLGRHGFAAWYRDPGDDGWPEDQVRHIHAVYAGEPMKLALRHQIHDYCAVPNRNGLASHAPYRFFHPSEEAVAAVRTLFLAHNPTEG